MQSKGSNKAAASREGKPMMFLIRAAFWLMIIVLLIPTDKDQQSQIYGTAQTAMNDLAGFCDRNPQTCATGQDAFEVLVQKAQYGAQMIMALVDQPSGVVAGGQPEPVPASGPVPMPENDAVMPVPSAVPLDPAAFEKWDADSSQDTLNSGDRETAWGGPRA